MSKELCDNLAAHPKFPWGKGLTLSGDHVLMSDNPFDSEMLRPVYDVDEERVYNESVERLQERGLLLEHPTTIGWMFTTLVEIWSKRLALIAVYESTNGVWTVASNSVRGVDTLGEGPRVGEALGKALLFSWESVE